jgi:hypothetical protein
MLQTVRCPDVSYTLWCGAKDSSPNYGSIKKNCTVIRFVTTRAKFSICTVAGVNWTYIHTFKR